MAYRIPALEQGWTRRDTMLYALGLGLGADPMDERELKFVQERGLVALPTMAQILCVPYQWLKSADVGMSGNSLHGEQHFTLHRPVPVEGSFIARPRVTRVVDKGAGSGMLVVTERDICDQASGEAICTVSTTTFCRGDGGFDGPTEPLPQPHQLPGRAPDIVHDQHILPQAAFIYALSGDPNPLHVDPQAARKAGFDRPILHGLCALGMSGVAILRHCCGFEPARLKSMAVRFAAPVYPDETLRTEIWVGDKPGEVSWRAVLPGRGNKVVLNNGHAVIAV
jgi:acyl dehydratase